MPPKSTAAMTAALALLATAAWSQTSQTSLWVPDGAVNAVAAANGVLYIGGGFTHLGPPTGGFAALDGATGAVLPPMSGVMGFVYASIPDGSGGHFIGGQFSHVQGQPHSNVAHLDAGGAVTSWDPGTFVGAVDALAIDPINPGVLFVGGPFSQVNGTTRNGLAAIDVATGALTTWNPGVSGGGVLSLCAINGVLYIGGGFNQIAGLTRNHLAEADLSHGVLGWNPDVNGIVYAMVPFINPIGGALTLYIGGEFTSIGGQARYSIAAVSGATGAPDAWSPNSDHAVKAIALALDRRGFLSSVYAGGTFDQIGAQPRQYLAQLDAGTGGATAWNPAPDAEVDALLLTSTSVVVAGDFSVVGGATRHYLAALDATSGAVTNFNPDPNYQVKTLDAYGSTVFAGGGFSSLGAIPRNHLAAIDPATGQPTAWDPGADGTVNALAVSGGTIYAGGSFLSVHNQARTDIVALDAAGSVLPWAPNANGAVNCLATAGNVVYAGGEFSYIGSHARARFAALDATTGVATGLTADADRPVYVLTLSGGLLYVGGGFSTLDGIPRLGGAAAIDLASGLLAPWNPGPFNGNSTSWVAIYAICPHGSTIFLGGDFATSSGLQRWNLVEVSSTGALTSWDSAFPATSLVRALLPRDETLYVGGFFAKLAGVNRLSLGVLSLPTRTALPWNPMVFGTTYSLALTAGALYAGGNFVGAAGWPNSCLAGFSENITAVDERPHPASAGTLNVSANPSSGKVWFTVSLPAAATTDVTVYDIAGRLVRRLLSGFLPAGENRIAWDGRDDIGRMAASGAYLVTVRGAGVSLARKLVRLE